MVSNAPSVIMLSPRTTVIAVGALALVLWWMHQRSNGLREDVNSIERFMVRRHQHEQAMGQGPGGQQRRQQQVREEQLNTGRESYFDDFSNEPAGVGGFQVGDAHSAPPRVCDGSTAMLERQRQEINAPEHPRGRGGAPPRQQTQARQQAQAPDVFDDVEDFGDALENAPLFGNG